MTVRKMGVEEELLLVDPDSGQLTAVAQQALLAHDPDRKPAAPPDGDGDAEVEAELFLQQIETATEADADRAVVERGIRAGRRLAGEAAAAAGARAVAMATPVLVGPDHDFTPEPRYQHIRRDYGELAHQALVCAMHVHVDVSDDDEAVAVADRLRPWLPVLLAVSANSPFWHGVDTGHASWRSQVWSRWPSAGPAEPFGDLATYRETSRTLLDWGASLDTGMLYFDVRLSEKYPTIEVRVADVCTDVDDALLVAVLARALVETEARTWRAGDEAPVWRADLARAATWRAARHGTAGPLVDPGQRALAPARVVLDSLVQHTERALSETGDLAMVRDGVDRLLADGNGAERQRASYRATGDFARVVHDLASRTEDSWS